MLHAAANDGRETVQYPVLKGDDIFHVNKALFNFVSDKYGYKSTLNALVCLPFREPLKIL